MGFSLPDGVRFFLDESSLQMRCRDQGGGLRGDGKTFSSADKTRLADVRGL